MAESLPSWPLTEAKWKVLRGMRGVLPEDKNCYRTAVACVSRKPSSPLLDNVLASCICKDPPEELTEEESLGLLLGAKFGSFTRKRRRAPQSAPFAPAPAEVEKESVFDDLLNSSILSSSFETAKATVRLHLFVLRRLDLSDVKSSTQLNVIFSLTTGNPPSAERQPSLSTRLYCLQIHKLVKYTTPKVFSRDLASHTSPLVQRLYHSPAVKTTLGQQGRQCTLVYSEAAVEPLSELPNLPNLPPLQGSVAPDVCFGVYNAAELLTMFHKTESELLEGLLTREYSNLDFMRQVDPVQRHFCFEVRDCANYNVSLDPWPGFGTSKQKLSSGDNTSPEDISEAARLCAQLLHQKYLGLPFPVRWGYGGRHLFENFFTVVKAPEGGPQRMGLVYTVDRASCAGFVFTVKSFVAPSMERLWQGLSVEMKVRVMRANLPGGLQEKEVLPGSEDSDSEPDD
eukprot:RCo047933